MTLRNLFLFGLLALLFAACDSDDDGNGVDPIVEPIVLSGTQTEPLVLENLFNDPLLPDYIVNGTFRIDGPVTVEPGVRIVMRSNSRIDVRSSGSFSAVGTQEQPIYIQGEQNVRGFWDYIAFQSNNPNNRLEYCIISNGGASSLSSFPASVVVRDNAQVGMRNSVITESARNGFIVNGNNATISAFENNSISNCDQHPIRIRFTQIEAMNESNDFTSGNGFNQIRVDGNTVDIPLTINPVAGSYLITSTTRLNSATTILPGVIFDMGPGSRLDIRNTGSLEINGTPTNRIIIRGDEAAKGFWDYIHYNGSNSPNNTIRYTDISYGGGSSLSCCGALVAVSSSGSLSIQESSFSNSQRWGITVSSNSTLEDLGGNEFLDNNSGDINN